MAGVGPILLFIDCKVRICVVAAYLGCGEVNMLKRISVIALSFACFIMFCFSNIAYAGKKNKKAHHKSGGGVPSQIAASGRKTFIFNPNSLTWGVYTADGKLVRTGHGSGGRHHCPDVGRGCKTPSGTFSIHSKMGPSFRSSRYPLPRGGAPMPYAMFFSKYYAIHGSNDVPGYNASHGCIRVYPSDARWLNQEFLSHGSRVIVRPY